MKVLYLVIPNEPPSGNHYVQHSRGRHFKTKEANGWYEAVTIWAIIKAKPEPPLVEGKAHSVEYWVYQGHGSRGDVDNYAKCILDSLVRAGVLESDATVVDLICHKRRDRDNPRTEIVVRAL